MVWKKVKAFPLIREIRKKVGGISTTNEKVLHVFELNKGKETLREERRKNRSETSQSQHWQKAEKEGD